MSEGYIQNDLKVVSVKKDKGKFTVVTSGARYEIQKTGKTGRIFCYQMLNEERLVATLDFCFSFSALTLDRVEPHTCVFNLITSGCSYLMLQINGDSLLDIRSYSPLTITVQGNFTPDYGAEKNDNILLIDKTGGIGLYPYKGVKLSAEFHNFTAETWQAKYALGYNARFFVSVFPPRRFNRTQFFEDRISHHGSIGPWAPYPYPSDTMLEELSKYANILVLHEGIWQGKLTKAGGSVKTSKDVYEEAAYCCSDYLPVNRNELLRVVKKSHALKMRVIPYMSPFYSMAKGMDIFLGRVREKIEEYSFDGVYYDRISTDITCSYDMMKNTRAMLKDKIIYLHCTIDPIGKHIYCPFIETYANYTIKAEHFSQFTEKYLRYVISGYNISNATGYICYYDYPLDFMRKLIDKALAFNARFYLGSPEAEHEKLLKKHYFPKLGKMRENQDA